VAHPVRFLSLLLAATCPVFVMAQDNKPSQPPTRARPALLVVDAQVGVLSSVWESKRVIANLETLAGTARSAGVPVIWVQHSDEDELKYGSAGWQLTPNSCSCQAPRAGIGLTASGHPHFVG
jgi:Isochorismatase family